MLRSSLTIALAGLSAVQALPTRPGVTERAAQIFGPPSSSFTPGDPPNPPKLCSPGTDRWCWSFDPPSPPPPRQGDPGDHFGFGQYPDKMAKRDSASYLPPSANQDRKDLIRELELRLQRLQNLPDKTRSEWREIDALRDALWRLAGIVDMDVPPGVVSTLTPGRKAKRWDISDLKGRIADLERRIEALQNLDGKSDREWRELRALRDELYRLADVLRIEAPPGTWTTLTPGKQKRQILTFPSDGGSDFRECPTTAGARRALELLLKNIRKQRLPGEAADAMYDALEAFLRKCGFEMEEGEDGTEIHDYDDDGEADWRLNPRDVEAEEVMEEESVTEDDFDPSGLEAAHAALLSALGDAKPSPATFMVLQTLAAQLSAHGIEVSPSAPLTSETPLTRRQSGSGTGVIAIGESACQLADVLALKAALAALNTAYGHPSHAPPSIFLVEQVIVSALQICHQDVPGWTTVVAGNPIPGGPMVPEKPVPGGPMVPDKPGDGGAVKPSN